MKKYLFGVSLALVAMSNMASAITVSTGDLGNNVITGNSGGYFSVILATPNPDNSLQALLDVKYGLWNGGPEDIDVYFNSTLVGTMVADQGYIVPGPEFAQFDVTGMLANGNNLIEFQGDLTQDYVIGQVDLTYSPVPEPATMAVLSLGAIGLLRRRKA